MEKLIIRFSLLTFLLFGLGGTVYAFISDSGKTTKDTYVLEAGTSEENFLNQVKQTNDSVQSVDIVEGQFDSTQLGKQHLSLAITDDMGNTETRKTNITIRDTKKPVIEGKDKYTVEIGETLDLLTGIKVSDNFDKEPQVRIGRFETNILGSFVTTITAEDISGNLATKPVTITVVDKQAPVIETEDTSIEVGSIFSALSGVTAMDNLDGDITEKLQISGEVDPKHAGVYTLTYTVADSQGNQSDRERRIVVQDSLKSADYETFENNVQLQTTSLNNAVDTTASTTSSSNSPTLNLLTNRPSVPNYLPMQIYFGNSVITYQNAGQGNGQAVIDSNPQGLAATWGGAAIQSGDDEKNTHFIGHNPGVFDELLEVKLGSPIIVTDGNGKPTTYVVTTTFNVDDYAVGISDGVKYWDTITGVNGGERITLQTCINDDVNQIVIAKKA